MSFPLKLPHSHLHTDVHTLSPRKHHTQALQELSLKYLTSPALLKYLTDPPVVGEGTQNTDSQT